MISSIVLLAHKFNFKSKCQVPLCNSWGVGVARRGDNISLELFQQEFILNGDLTLEYQAKNG